MGRSGSKSFYFLRLAFPTYHENNRIVTKTSHWAQESAKVWGKTVEGPIVCSIIWTVCEIPDFLVMVHEYRIVFFQKKTSSKYNHIQLMLLFLKSKSELRRTAAHPWTVGVLSETLVFMPAGVIDSIGVLSK